MRRVRWSAFCELEKYGDAATPLLISYLSSENPENQEFAASAVGNSGDTTAIMPLRKLLTHPWENVRTSAMYSLAKLGDTALVPTLLEMIDDEQAGYPQAVIYNIFGQLGTEEAWPELVRGAESDNNWVRMAAVKAMANIYPERTTPYLIPLFSSEQVLIRGDAAALANQLLDDRTLPYLRKLLNDENYEVRFLASTAIRSIESGR